MEALAWPAAMYGCKSWTLRKNEKTRLDAFEKKGLMLCLTILVQTILACDRQMDRQTLGHSKYCASKASSG